MTGLRYFLLASTAAAAFLTGSQAEAGNPLAFALAATVTALLTAEYVSETRGVAAAGRARESGPITPAVLHDLGFTYHDGDEEWAWRRLFRPADRLPVTLCWLEEGLLLVTQPPGVTAPAGAADDRIEVRCVTAAALRRWVAAVDGGD